jgi:hypothetical protein
MYMEMSQRNSSIAILNKQKYLFFSLTKSENKRSEQILSGEVGSSGRGEDVGKGYGRVNMVKFLWTHECKWKNATC